MDLQNETTTARQIGFSVFLVSQNPFNYFHKGN